MDRLTELFENWRSQFENKEPSTYQAFQGGFSTSAVSMRERAMAVVDAAIANSPDSAALLNEVKNAIGGLSDIPQ